MHIYDERQMNIMLQEIQALKDKVRKQNLLLNLHIFKIFYLSLYHC